MERHQSHAVKRHRAGLKSGNEELASIHFHSQSQCSQGLYIHGTEAGDDGLSLFTFMCYFGKFTSLRTHFTSTGCMIRGVIYVCSTNNVGRVLCESLLFIVTGCFNPQISDPKYGQMHILVSYRMQ